MISATGAAVSTPIGIIVAMKSTTSTVARARRPVEQVADPRAHDDDDESVAADRGAALAAAEEQHDRPGPRSVDRPHGRARRSGCSLNSTAPSGTSSERAERGDELGVGDARVADGGEEQR